MKKKLFLFLLLMLVISPSMVLANTIYSIDMDINIDRDGNASITEEWDVDGEDGTEWYKVINNLEGSEVSNFHVSMDGNPLQYKDWNVNESLSQKRGYYGINYTQDGIELCFGKYDYNHHIFTLTYNLSNFIINTSDYQVIQWKLIDTLSNVEFRDFSINVSGYYYFPDDIDVWGYGYRGYAYVKDGKIQMSNEDYMGDNYVALLARFPLGTFNTNHSKEGFDTFDDVYRRANEGAFEYDYGEYNDFDSDSDSIFDVIFGIIEALFIFGTIGGTVAMASKNGYGYKDNKVIDKKEVPMFRDIPCNKDIYYANALINLNSFGYSDTNIFGAIILKWIKENKIQFKNEVKGIFNKNTSVIDLTMNPTFDNSIERELFDIMYEASIDGMLESKELEKWGRKHYSRFLDIFTKIKDNKITELKNQGHIYNRVDKTECKKKHVMDDTIYNDSVKLYGLKKFLTEFSNMHEKDAIEVKLWDEYLMFAYLFGMADKVAKQFKNLYPEIVQEMSSYGVDYDTFLFINYISSHSVSAATSARSAAESYSGGGGGFSSGGGGGGFSGGGGGGSR